MNDYLKKSEYFETIAEGSLILCGFFAVIQLVLPSDFYFIEVALFVVFIVMSYLSYDFKKRDYKRKTEIIRKKKEECNCYNTMATCDTEYD